MEIQEIKIDGIVYVPIEVDPQDYCCQCDLQNSCKPVLPQHFNYGCNICLLFGKGKVLKVKDN